MARAMSLVKAYLNNQVPPNGAFIISSNFDEGSTYSIYEITAYANVKDIFKTPEGLVFKTDGNRTHLLIEPPTFSQRYEEPIHREKGKSIPYRFNEMEILTGKRQEKFMIPQEPQMLYSSFTVHTAISGNFTFIFYKTEDVFPAMKKFIADTLYNDCNLAKQDSAMVANSLLETLKRFSIWEAQP